MDWIALDQGRSKNLEDTIIKRQRISRLVGGLFGLCFMELAAPQEVAKCDNNMEFSLNYKKGLYEVLLYSP